MSSRAFPLIQTAPVPSGPPEYQEKVKSMFQDFVSQVPKEYYISQKYIDSPPKDVSGIPKECGLLSREELDITENYDAVGLAEAIASKKLTAVQVATAFSKRAIIAEQITCCLTEWFMDEAVQRAQELDDYLASTGKTVGPLHGVPISLKEHMPLAGHWSSAGAISTRVKDEQDCPLVAILRKLGAVFYCKSNQPQSLMHLESVSPYGRVLNPYNINLSAGGSTGGEAALIALRGSVLGVGTDIGGSVRCPSGVCGGYGFKPTSYTLPMWDLLHGGAVAELNILISTGPMCNSLRDMDLFMASVLSQKPYLEDPRLIPIPWTGLQAKPNNIPLKIGIMMNDGAIQPQPPVTRALEWARKQLHGSDQVEVKQYTAYKAADAIKLIRKAYWPDGGKALKEHLEDDQEPMYALSQWIIKDAEGPQLTAQEIHAQRMSRDQFRCEFAVDWNSQDVDFVICPVFVGPACAHDTSLYWNYTALWNYVDYPGAVFPTPIKALKPGEEDYDPANATPLSEEDKHVRQLWAEGDFEGAPIDLQIVARKYHDNELFGALNILKDALQLK